MSRVCVDAMGGDEPPEVVLEGVAAALEIEPTLEVLLVGDKAFVEPFCATHDRVYPLISSEVIAMGEHPAQAVRKKRDSSIVRGCKALRAKEADAFFSAGSTGAVLTAATLYVGRVKGLIRPALAAVITRLGGAKAVFLDLGANADCRPEMLVQFALMGQVMAAAEFGLQNPTVALLSNGTEDAKGSEATLAAHAALEAARAKGVNFVGNCEGTDILLGSADVIVCDGFTGNVALKSMEGSAVYLARRLRAMARKNLVAALGGLLVKGSFEKIAEDLSGDAHGGAVLLGCKAPVFVGHGATSPKAIANGTLAALRAVNHTLSDDIARVLA